FILRIEDTDRERSSDAMTDAILDGMTWLGLAWDEGPFHQADGFSRHAADVQELIADGAAYRCFCSAEALEARRGREAVANEAYRYDRFCVTTLSPEDSERRAAAREPFVVRFRVPAGTTTWNDAVYGRIEFDNAEIEDFIILRTDGTPIYNMAVVSDDVHMRITHVIRGDDHISNTPKQILLYEGLGAPLPTFAHVPMILGPDGKRLSKRHGATAVGEYSRLGILPSAMLNFLALLGWSPGTSQEIFTPEELIAQFSLEGINRKSAVFDVQKLRWLNGQHINRMAADDLKSLVREALVDEGIDPSGRSETWLRALIDLLKARARNIPDIARQARPYLVTDIDYEPDAVEKHWKEPEQVAHRLARLQQRFATLNTWDAATLEQDLRALADELGVGAAKLIHPLRVALTGSAVGPGIFEVAALMGRDLVLSRTDAAVDRLEHGAAEEGS
ncbi:MAG: glutamate--tRNA ligase, partial [Longimicrobiales bacterium]